MDGRQGRNEFPHWLWELNQISRLAALSCFLFLSSANPDLYHFTHIECPICLHSLGLTFSLIQLVRVAKHADVCLPLFDFVTLALNLFQR